MRTIAFRRCNLKYAGWLHDENSAAVVVDLQSYDVFSCTLELITGSMSGTDIHVQWANGIHGPWTDFDTHQHFDNTKRATVLMGQVGPLVRLSVETASASDALADIVFSMRSSQLTPAAGAATV